MKKFLYSLSTAAVIATLLLSSCKKTEDVKPKDQGTGAGDEEAITRITLTFASASGDVATASFTDPDDSGPKLPTITGLTLKKGMIYNGTIKIYDDTKTPIKFVNEEIQEESNAHRFHYVYSPAAASTTTMPVDITDKDLKNLPLGLTYTAKVGSATGTGKLRVTLRHFDGITKTNNIADGEADFDLDFDVVIVD